jgi:hypothetical protein
VAAQRPSKGDGPCASAASFEDRHSASKTRVNAVFWRKRPSQLLDSAYLRRMPHQFKLSPDHPAVAYLVRLHANIGGRILENKKEGLRLVESMKHVEHVIRMFNPNYNMRGISVRRRVTGNPWFKRGTLIRHALEVLREGQEALTRSGGHQARKQKRRLRISWRVGRSRRRGFWPCLRHWNWTAWR